MLEIKNLSVNATFHKDPIIKDLSLNVGKNEIHLLLGPNGVGKSTLAKAIMAWPDLKVEGEVLLNGEEISSLPMEERARKGLFLAHQAPIEIPGVHLIEFIRTAYNNMRDESEHIDPWAFKDMFEAVAGTLGLGSNFSDRNLNEGFSGGERRKNEIVQMILLQPKIAILDEVDSGLDIDSLKTVFTEINDFVKENDSGIILISHNPKILDYIAPTNVHVMGKQGIVESGDIKLAEEVISKGYRKYE